MGAAVTAALSQDNSPSRSTQAAPGLWTGHEAFRSDGHRAAMDSLSPSQDLASVLSTCSNVIQIFLAPSDQGQESRSPSSMHDYK